jgi:xanthine dehydrogenase accessory factor
MSAGDMSWLDRAMTLLGRGEACVLVTVVQTRGSTPRDAGVKMLVWKDGLCGTVGGGRLEFDGIVRSRAMLDSPAAAVIERFSLGPQLAQCCGGSVTLLFERLDAAALPWLTAWAEAERSREDMLLVTRLGDGAGKTFLRPTQLVTADLPGVVAERLPTFVAGVARCHLIESHDRGDAYVVEAIGDRSHPLYLFGAGHVGRAIVQAVAPLPFRITWIDSRPDAFPGGLPAAIATRAAEALSLLVDEASAGTFFLVMTHSHPLDLDICARVLQRDDFAFLGLIGSETKRARFAGRLRAIGIPPQALGRLTCPIGIPGIASKEPAAIAAAVAAQLLILAERQAVQPAVSMTAVVR